MYIMIMIRRQEWTVTFHNVRIIQLREVTQSYKMGTLVLQLDPHCWYKLGVLAIRIYLDLARIFLRLRFSLRIRFFLHFPLILIYIGYIAKKRSEILGLSDLDDSR